MSGTQRRAEILVAARTVFAERGYAASTDEVARAAGVSQPYVVRLFGTKRELFLEAYSEASAQILEALGAVPAGPDAGTPMGDAYVGLLADRDLLRLVMHGFIAGADEEVGPRRAAHAGGGVPAVPGAVRAPTTRPPARSSRRACSSTCSSRSTRRRTAARTAGWTRSCSACEDGIAERRTA